MALSNRVAKLICQVFNVCHERIVPQAELINDLEADSLSLKEFFMSLEEEFFLEDIADEEAAGIRNVGDVINYLEQH